MTDREKVIKGLEAHEKGCGYRSHYCDVMECPYRYGDESCDIEEMCHDALELLKEQKEMPKLVKIDGEFVTVKYGHCPTCGEGLNQEVYPHWCGFCGQAVKWE